MCILSKYYVYISKYIMSISTYHVYIGTSTVYFRGVVRSPLLTHHIPPETPPPRMTHSDKSSAAREPMTLMKFHMFGTTETSPNLVLKT